MIRKELQRLEALGIPFIHRIIITGIMEYAGERGAFGVPLDLPTALKKRGIEPLPEVIASIEKIHAYHATEGARTQPV